jgi:hypothetical protein
MVKKKRGLAVFVIYDAYGDWLSSNGFIRYLNIFYKKVLLVIDYSQILKKYPTEYFVKTLYRDNKNIKIIKNYQFRVLKFFSFLIKFDIFDVCYNENNLITNKRGEVYNKNNKFIKTKNISVKTKLDNASLYYFSLGLSKKIRLNNFYCRRFEVDYFYKFQKVPYVAICEMYKNQINRKFIPKNIKIINLHNLSDNIIKLIQLIESAKEVHLIENSIALLVYHMQFKKFMKLKKINLHLYARKEPERIYTKDNKFIRMLLSPKLKNWNLITR